MSRDARAGLRGRNNFDAIRLFAAFAVVVQHVTAHLDVTFLWVRPHSPWWFYDGVPLFFIMSGLFVFRSAERMRARGAGWRTFYRNRLLRVAPGIWAYLVVTVLALLAVGALHLRELATVPGLAWVASTLLLVPVYSPPFLDDLGVGAVNGSLWTIPAEVSFYVVVPLLVLAAARLGRRSFVVALLGAGLVLALLPMLGGGVLGDLYVITFLPYLWYFAIGIGWHRLLGAGVSPSGTAALGGAVGYVLLTAAGHMAGDVKLLFTVLAAVPLSVAAIWVGQRGPRVLEAVTRRLGDLSFGVYVWHMPVVNLLLWAGLHGSRVAGYGAALAALVMGWLSWHLVEKPALSRKRASSRTPGVEAARGG